MRASPTIVRDNETLFRLYNQLQKNDIICTRIRLRPGEESLLTDLVTRGVVLIPSATAQLASRSKCFQARVFKEMMVPGTLPVHDHHTLLQATSLFVQNGHTKIILKQDRKNGGLGVHLFNSIEDLYNLVGGAGFSFPFVIQPFMENSRDVRVIILGDYTEAYARTNPHNFRKNLHCGGTSVPHALSPEQLAFCRKAMRRGGFAYAHLDLLFQPDDSYSLMEINLRGGLKGARINGREYQKKLAALHEDLLREAYDNI